MKSPSHARYDKAGERRLSTCDPDYSSGRVRERLELAASMLEELEIGDRARSTLCPLIDSYRRLRNTAERLEQATDYSWASLCDQLDAEWIHFLRTIEPLSCGLELAA